MNEENPITLFNKLHDEYKESIQKEKLTTEYPYIMTLATCTKNGFPSARQVLLKEVKEEGFVFFTNYESRKAKEIQENPNVALVFYWREVGRQIRVEGEVTKLPKHESDDYFSTRPRSSQINSILSKQSQILTDKSKFLEEIQEMENRKEEKFERPESWGGYLVKPRIIEFWKNGEFRLHDRLRFSLNENEWKTESLYP